jgi:hypothetical protein
MAGKRSKEGRGPKARSAEQRQGSAAVAYVMNAWEDLSDQEHRTWRVQGKSLRTTEINYFKKFAVFGGRKRGIGLRHECRVEAILRPPSGYPQAIW